MKELLILFCILSLGYLYYKYKDDIAKELWIALGISAVWVYFSGIYNYAGFNYFIFGVNIFPLACWTFGLVILREIYEEFKKGRFGLNRKYAFVYATIFYVGALILFEYIGYNLWDVQLVTEYTGLFGLELLHAPTFAKIYYMTIGPIYLLITDIILDKKRWKLW